MDKFELKEKYDLYDLAALIALLRGEDGCPWDKEQTHESIRKNFIEEVYECVEAIDNGDKDLLKEELGDVLMQVMLHSDMERERGTFDINDVADAVSKKLIYRHPHVFGDVVADTPDEVLKNWDELKKVEKDQQDESDAIASVSKWLPALMRAHKIQDKAAKAGLDWNEIDGPLEKLREEIDELLEVIDYGPRERVKEEIGDILFSTVNIARFMGIDAEEALYNVCDKFASRFACVERLARRKLRKSFRDLTYKELDALWEEAKVIERE